MQLFKYKWLIPIIAQTYSQGGTRFVSLHKELNMSRSMLTSTVAHLKAYGLITENLGHGHPLRPEIILTPLGRRIAPFCAEFVNLIQRKNMAVLFQNIWAVPILFKTNTSQVHFNEYKKELKPVTSKALSESLSFLVSQEFMIKKVISQGNIKIVYELPKKIITICDPFFNHQRIINGHL